MTIKVKELEWSKYQQAHFLGLRYEMYETMQGVYNVLRNAPDYERLGTGVLKEEALQLAKEDCNRLVLSVVEEVKDDE